MTKLFSYILLAATLVLLAINQAHAETEFCRGFKQGYATGFKSIYRTPHTPITPNCPVKPSRMLSDPKTDFEFGYVVGTKAAYKKAQQIPPTIP